MGGWRGPSVPGEFPTLGYLWAAWIEQHCRVPDRHSWGEPFATTPEQTRHLLFQARLKPEARVDRDKPSAPFQYVGTVMVRPQKWGKGPLSASRIMVQAAGPALFAGWADPGDYYACSDHGCPCGWVYEYEPGEPMGEPWPPSSVLVQVTATSEDQTANIWRALMPMAQLGPLAAVWDIGLTRIQLPSGGRIEPVTAEATSRLGARLTYGEQDETHSWLKRNGGHALADTQRRNLAGTGGRWAATTNGWDPSEASVAQQDYEAGLSDVYIDYPKPLPGSWLDKRVRRRKLKHAYKGAPWVDIDRIESDCDRLEAKGEANQARRFFGNELPAGGDAAFNVEAYADLAQPDYRIKRGAKVGLTFDGALKRDTTVLEVVEIKTGHRCVVAAWARPSGLPDDHPWTVPIDEVDEAVAWAMGYFDVWRLYGDPPHYREDLARWAGQYGSDRVIEWWTNRRKEMAFAVREHTTAIEQGALSHGPLDDSPQAARNHKMLIEHHGNAVQSQTKIANEDTGGFLWIISKSSPASSAKIDAAMTDVLATRLRTDAIRLGIGDDEPGGIFVFR